MTQAPVAAPRPWFEIRDLQFRVWPIVLAAVLMQLCLVPARELARWVFHSGPPSWEAHVGLFVFGATMLQGVCALIGILILRVALPRADANLRWPPGRSYFGLAAVLGGAMGLIMLAADYWPALMQGKAPDAGYPLDPPLAAGWLLAMITTGLGEETLFRGLLVGMLAALVPGRVRVGAFEISVAGVIVALLFAVAHYDSFLHSPLHLAIAQQSYAFAWGLAYVWLMERSKSLAAPIIAHGLGNFVEVGLVMALMSGTAAGV